MALPAGVPPTNLPPTLPQGHPPCPTSQPATNLRRCAMEPTVTSPGLIQVHYIAHYMVHYIVHYIVDYLRRCAMERTATSSGLRRDLPV